MSVSVLDSGPRVRLRNWFERPYDDAIAAARTCYSPRVIDAAAELLHDLDAIRLAQVHDGE